MCTFLKVMALQEVVLPFFEVMDLKAFQITQLGGNSTILLNIIATIGTCATVPVAW
jgi:hypothetical protein